MMYTKLLGAWKRSVSFPNINKQQHCWADICDTDFCGSFRHRTEMDEPSGGGRQGWERQVGVGAGTLVGSLSHRQGASFSNLTCAALAVCDMHLGSCENFFRPLQAVVPFYMVCLYFPPLHVTIV